MSVIYNQIFEGGRKAVVCSRTELVGFDETYSPKLAFWARSMHTTTLQEVHMA